MKIHDILDVLFHDELFQSWQKENKGYHLAHMFIVIEKGSPEKCDVGFFDPKKRKMTTFLVGSEDVVKQDADDVFLEEDKTISELIPDKVKVDISEAERISQDFQREKYKSHQPIKAILILQNLDIGQVWNVTYVTKQFQTLNMKIDAETGKVVEDKLHQIFSF